ncbi:MAG: GNAT family N-acetyltransferase [Clostridia bacterium]|nr:GNAT family N-acetyltransferase [Clostridia bacterium]MCL6521424.1 GNAT family N-acetyltransferase [Bacillota bacterium]
MARVILRDGTVAELRPLGREARDRERLRELFRSASPDSLYFRFFHAVREVSERELERLLAGDGREALALVCEAGERFLAVGNYAPAGEPGTAEVAFLVDDRYQGRGLGTLLLEHLAEAAWRAGYQRFEAVVLPANRRMIQVLYDSGYETRERWEDGAVRMVLPLGATERSRALQETREKLATAASLEPFFRPATVAVVGASRDPQRLGHLLFRHLLEGGFQGVVYPVNPSAHAVAAVRAYPSLRDLPEPVDLAVVVVPAREVLQVVDDCVQARVRAVLITSAGFADAGPEGEALQQEVVRRLRAAGIRLVGPNCLGIVNTAEAVRLNASFAPRLPARGRLAFASQSGALGVAILDALSRIGVGLSSFVSMGNKADVSGNDCLQYWEDDPETEMIALYLESFGNPRKFSRICRRITPRKPVLVVRGARTAAGVQVSEARQAAGQAREVAVEALFRQAGIIRADTLEELFDVAAVLEAEPLPAGERVAVVTNSAGGAVITVDALRAEGLLLARPPLDLGFEALAEGYRRALPEVLRDPEVDAVVVLFVPAGLSDEAAVARALLEGVREAEAEGVRKPVVANFLPSAERAYAVRFLDPEARRLPVYPFPERTVRALARAARYAAFRRRPRGRIPDLEGADVERARQLAREALERLAPDEEERWLPAEEAEAVVAAAGLEVEPSRAPERGLRLAVTVEPDPLFGPLLLVRRLAPTARRGEFVPLGEPLARITPLTDLEAADLAAAALGEGAPAEAVACLADLFLRLSRLAEEVPELRRLELPDVRPLPPRACAPAPRVAVARP